MTMAGSTTVMTNLQKQLPTIVWKWWHAGFFYNESNVWKKRPKPHELSTATSRNNQSGHYICITFALHLHLVLPKDPRIVLLGIKRCTIFSVVFSLARAKVLQLLFTFFVPGTFLICCITFTFDLAKKAANIQKRCAVVELFQWFFFFAANSRLCVKNSRRIGFCSGIVSTHITMF